MTTDVLDERDIKDLGEVLLVEDDQEVREQIRETLHEYGVSVCEADSSAQLGRLLDRQPWSWRPGLVLIDLVIPGASGYDVIRKLVERYREKKFPVVVVSKLVTGDDIVEAQMAGADVFVAKPLKPRKLLEGIKAGLDNHRKPPEERSHNIIILQ